MKIIILGPPGVGKGTQSKDLSKKLGIPHISTGDILREEVKRDSILGRKAKEYIDAGGLVPDDLVIKMLEAKLSGQEASAGFILDGFPRNIAQAEALDKILLDRHSAIDTVFYLDAAEDVIIQRLSGRRLCSKCGAIFHIVNMPPKKDGVCDKCGSLLYQRSDDKPQTIKNRLEIYLKETAVLIDYYRNEHKLYYIDANKEAEAVIAQMLGILKDCRDHTKV